MVEDRLARGVRRLCCFLVASAALVDFAPAAASQPRGTLPDASPFNVGLRICELPCTDHAGRQAVRTTAVWYPTRAAPKRYTYPPRTAPGEPTVTHLALDAPPAGDAGPFPLVMFIHGGFGCAVNSAFFCEHLAAHGYVVCASDYTDVMAPEFKEQLAFGRLGPGRTDRPGRVLIAVGQWARFMNANRDKFVWYLNTFRVKPASEALDGVLALNRDPRSPLKGLIDPARIGVAGHSLGGATIQGLCGANPDPKFTDRRIQAALLLSAPIYPWDQRQEQITIPRMLMSGDCDEPMNPDFPRRLGYVKAPAPRSWLILKDATHFAFGNPPGENLSSARRTNAKARVICRYGLAFFDRYLSDRKDAETVLSQTEDALTYYCYEMVKGDEHVFGTEPPYGPGTDGASGGLLREIRERWRRRANPPPTDAANDRRDSPPDRR